MSGGLRSLLRLRVLLPALILAVALGVGIERLIVTDAEAVQGRLDDARAFSLEGRWNEAVDLLDPDYDFEGITREDLRTAVRETLKGRPLKQFQYFRREVEILPGRTAVARVTIFLRAPEGAAGWDDRMGGEFEIRFRKRDDLGWVVTAIRQP